MGNAVCALRLRWVGNTEIGCIELEFEGVSCVNWPVTCPGPGSCKVSSEALCSIRGDIIS
jgi:hypothetical protein